MRVVLDSCVIVGDYQMRGPTFRAFLEGLAGSDHSLHVPQVVIDEVMNKCEEHLHGCEDEIEKQLARVRAITDAEIESPLAGSRVDILRTGYQETLCACLEDADASILPYPEVSHESLARRALGRRKPFRPKGGGYRDSLVWHTVLELAARAGENVAFVTEDSKDFLDDDGRLHRHLESDLVQLGLPRDRVIAFRGLSRFVDDQIKPRMEQLEQIRRQLERGEYPGLDLAEEIEMWLPGAAEGREWTSSEVGLPPEFESPTISSVQDLGEIRVLDVRDMPLRGELLVRVGAEAHCEFDVFVYKTYYYSMGEDEAPYAWDPDWNRHYVAACTMARVQVRLEMTVERSTGRVTSADLLELHSAAS